MVKLLFASALAAVATAGGGDPGITATCKEDNTIEVTIDYSHDADILSATYGTCNKTHMDGADSTDTDSWLLTLDPSRCGMESKLRNLVYNQTASFVIGRTDGTTEIVFSTMTVDSYCNYTSEYTVTFNYGPVNADSYDFDTSGGLVGLNFFIKSYADNGYDTPAPPSTTAGDKIFLMMELNSTLNADFDHADNLQSTTGKMFVPTKCEVTDDQSNNYVLFDAGGSAKCTNAFIKLEVFYRPHNQGGQAWNIEHTLFLLNNETSSSYVLSCNIRVCDGSRSAACTTAAACIQQYYG